MAPGAVNVAGKCQPENTIHSAATRAPANPVPSGREELQRIVTGRGVWSFGAPSMAIHRAFATNITSTNAGEHPEPPVTTATATPRTRLRGTGNVFSVATLTVTLWLSMKRG
jgi:hypothetical protein